MTADEWTSSPAYLQMLDDLAELEKSHPGISNMSLKPKSSAKVRVTYVINGTETVRMVEKNCALSMIGIEDRLGAVEKWEAYDAVYPEVTLDMSKSLQQLKLVNDPRLIFKRRR